MNDRKYLFRTAIKVCTLRNSTIDRFKFYSYFNETQEFNCYYNNLRENLEKSMKYCNHTNEDCNQLIRNYY
jgi:hypothetical protein